MVILPLLTKLKCCFPVCDSEDAAPSDTDRDMQNITIKKRRKKDNWQLWELRVGITGSGTPWREPWSVSRTLVSGTQGCCLCVRLGFNSWLHGER